MIYNMFWGMPSQPGALSNLREVIQRTQADNTVKVFNTGDEFFLHAFRSHLLVSILCHLKMENASDPLSHSTSLSWLKTTAKELVTELLMPKVYNDPVHHLHKNFPICMWEAIRWGNGPQIITPLEMVATKISDNWSQ